jgi:2-amino-4-hydroxy-6-hydroxymethyldihydropteridine diphosphokinase
MRLLIGLGGNSGNVAARFARAAANLEECFRLLGASGLWRSAAVGPQQTDFLNAALLLEVDVHPLEVLAVCLRLEQEAGRRREDETRWGPRPLDLDLLAAGDLVVESTMLALPHPRLADRRFALLPAAELAPSWLHPRAHRTFAELADALDQAAQRCERIGEFPTLAGSSQLTVDS